MNGCKRFSAVNKQMAGSAMTSTARTVSKPVFECCVKKGLEKDWRDPRRRMNDLTFLSLLILHYYRGFKKIEKYLVKNLIPADKSSKNINQK